MVMKLAVVVVLAAAFLLAGCGDKRPCLRSHQAQVTTWVLVGKVLVPMIHTETVCDERAAS